MLNQQPVRIFPSVKTPPFGPLGPLIHKYWPSTHPCLGGYLKGTISSMVTPAFMAAVDLDLLSYAVLFVLCSIDMAHFWAHF